ncbi:ATP-binding cassette domain-containing protein [Sphingobacterium hungaricum]|uniref:Multidrug ABC transporter ATP-binding protein n=1 Tax=Sphingobacterium hungaricum TaxID=2082723 RepID=A0A928YP88_9SPHI|nr:ATP-binding cassette domain-containing protein [Sphingobacterium hungaricum]MBE8712856.1 multidrug ABC transporter ATP-binding protein [Sphingobacterium hungaricum]
MSIKVENLTKTYGNQKAVDGLSFEIGEQKIVGFLGPNGAGKSTTMKCITGILPFEQGTISISGFNIQTDPLTAKRQIGFLPEHNPLYTDLYVKEILAYEADLQQVKNKQRRIEEVIALTGLQLEQHKKINQLSKGYRQRVGLALAIIHDPKVLILDEPTTGLDPNQILEIRNLIKELAKNKTVLLSTHIMQEVEAICDEIIILHKGILKINLPLAEIKNQQQDETVESLFVKLTN